MCFSATASFTAAALLLPVGGVALARSIPSGEGDAPAALSALPLALSPLFFAIQQAIEGMVWIGVEGGGDAIWLRWAALLYLFFAYGFWPAWIPFAVLRFTTPSGRGGWRESLMALLLVLGGLMGSSLWLPLLLEAAPPIPAVVEGSLRYPTPALFTGLGFAPLGEALYGLVIGIPLLLCSSLPARFYGLLLMVAFGVTEGFFRPSFSSVWCYFCALLSTLILVIVWDGRRSGGDILPSSLLPEGSPGA